MEPVSLALGLVLSLILATMLAVFILIPNPIRDLIIVTTILFVKAHERDVPSNMVHVVYYHWFGKIKTYLGGSSYYYFTSRYLPFLRVKRVINLSIKEPLSLSTSMTQGGRTTELETTLKVIDYILLANHARKVLKQDGCHDDIYRGYDISAIFIKSIELIRSITPELLNAHHLSGCVKNELAAIGLAIDGELTITIKEDEASK